jgi:Zn-dependent metalloprotease
MCTRNHSQCILPPYITEQLAKSPNPQIRDRAIAHLSTAATMRAFREAAQAMPTLMAALSPNRQRHRLVYDAQQTDQLPGTLVRSEGQAAVADAAVNEAYDFSGDTYDFYNQVFQRNSLDDNGMTLVSFQFSFHT